MTKKFRMKTKDVAFQFRMGAGIPGDVNRTHPASIEPVMPNATTPPLFFGEGVIVDAAGTGVRPLAAADTAVTKLYGITVRPFPFQAAQGGNYGSAPLGSAQASGTGVLDVLREGYIMAQIPAGATCKKDQPVFIWCAASSAGHVQGGFEVAASAGNTAAITNATFNGPPDAAGNVEVIIHM
jgi:hypothetical protein